VDNSDGQLEAAAAAGAELVELEPLDDVELDFSDEDADELEELVDSELLPFDELLLASRLSLR
jgi:hypothetical protein